MKAVKLRHQTYCPCHQFQCLLNRLILYFVIRSKPMAHNLRSAFPSSHFTGSKYTYFCGKTFYTFFKESMHEFHLACCFCFLNIYKFCFVLQIITPFHNLILCADSRKEMDEWLGAIKSVRNGEFYEVGENLNCENEKDIINRLIMLKPKVIS